MRPHRPGRLLLVVVTFALLASAAIVPVSARAQELGGAGAITGTIVDPTGGVIVSAAVSVINPVSGLQRQTTTDNAGKFEFRNLPFNPYHLRVDVQGFQALVRDVDVRSAVPVNLTLTLALGATTTTVDVEANDLLERDPTAHTDVDESLISKLAVEPQSGLNQAVTLAAPGIVAGSTFATPAAPLTACDSSSRGATRLAIPADGTENDDTNPPRIAPRHLFDIGAGVDNLFGTTRRKVRLQASVINLTNRVALYNFLSTFSGTHFVTPRTVRVTVGVTF